MVSGDAVEIVPPDELSRPVDAVVWEGRYDTGDPEAFVRQGIPVVRVVVSDDPPGPPTRAILTVTGQPQADRLKVSPTDFMASARQIAKWLGTKIKVEVTLEERHMLEVVLKAAQDVLDSDGASSADPEDVAQAYVATETIAAQLRAPRPSRRVLSWAVGQLATFPAGLITGIAAPYIVELINRLAS